MEEGGAAACLSTLDKAVRTQGAASYSKGCVHALFCKACIPSLFGAPQTKMRQKFSYCQGPGIPGTIPPSKLQACMYLVV